MIHFYRNVWTAVPSGNVKRVAAMLKAIHAQEDGQAAKEKAHQVAATLRGIRLARAAEIVEAGIDETLTYCAMPAEHWRVFAPMTLWNGRCAKSDEESVRWGGRLEDTQVAVDKPADCNKQ